MQTSVAMATYMGSAYIVEQLTSVLQQTAPPAEIVVCDDCSTDETVRLVSEFARDCPVPVRLFVNDERLGWRGNSLKAASLCRSEVIVLCDQDDVWDPRKIELLSAAFADDETLVVFHDATIVGAGLEPIGPFLQGDGEPDRARAMERAPWRDVYGFTMAFRRRLLDLWRYWPSSIDKSVGHERAAHDQWLLFLGSSLGVTRHLPERLALYRQHGRNAVSAKDAIRRMSGGRDHVDYGWLLDLRLRVTDSRIAVLEEIAREHDGFRTAASAALAAYRSYGSRLATQAVIYGSDSPVRRLRSLISLLRRGSYSGDMWALSRSMVLRDVAAAVVGPTGLTRRVPRPTWAARLRARTER